MTWWRRRDGATSRFEIGEDLPGRRAAGRCADPRRRAARRARPGRARCRCRPTSPSAWPTPSATRPCSRERPASAAAPTAGLHLTAGGARPAARGRGARSATRGAGGGSGHLPPGQHRAGRGPRDPHRALRGARRDLGRRRSDRGDGRRRVVAVGTTTVRALESRRDAGELSGRTDLFITPGFRFQVVDVLMTNFHLPRSSLLALVRGVRRPAVAGPVRHRRRTRATASSPSATPCCWSERRRRRRVGRTATA